MRERIAYGQLANPLPYALQNSYRRDLRPQEISAVQLTNGRLEALVLPSLGGRLWSLRELVADRDLVFTNRRLQFANFALTDAWFAGGIEWNLGSTGHAATTCRPVFAGSVSSNRGAALRIWEWERTRDLVFSVDLLLPADRPLLLAFIRVRNPDPEPKPLYWWTNIAAPEEPGVRVLAPAARVPPRRACAPLSPSTSTTVDSARMPARYRGRFRGVARGLDPAAGMIGRKGAGVAVILFAPVTFNLAETTRMIEVARALGHGLRAEFMGYEDDFVHLIREAGFAYRALQPAWTREQRQQALDFDQGRTIRSPFTVELVGRRVDAERRLIRELGASAVVIGSNITSLLSARAERVPLFYPVPFALTGPQVAQTRRMHLVQGSSAVARTADRVATAAFRWLYTRAPVAPRAFAKVAKANGVQPLRTVASMLEADVNLLTVMPWELDGYDLPAGYRRVGPIFARIDTPVPPLVHELAAAPEPLVYLGLGSSADRGLALGAARVLGDLPINVVAPIAHYLDPGDEVPANVHVTGLLPAHRLGGLVDAAVLHGGQGTVQTACATGVPFVGFGLQPEQVWNVEVCVRQGNAIRIPPRRVGRPEFRAAVERVLVDPAIRDAATRMQQAFEGEDGAVASARIIEAAVVR